MKLTREQQYILFILHSHYHACWSSGNFRSQGISRHGIDTQSLNIPSPASEQLVFQHSHQDIPLLVFVFLHQMELLLSCHDDGSRHNTAPMPEWARNTEGMDIVEQQAGNMVVILKHMLQIKFMGTFCEIALWLTQWGWDKMATISQTTFSNAFSWMKLYEFWLRFH